MAKSNGRTGYLFLDPIPQYRITEIEYDRWSAERVRAQTSIDAFPSQERLHCQVLSEIQARLNANNEINIETIIGVLLSLAHRDTEMLLIRLRQSLDELEAKLASWQHVPIGDSVSFFRSFLAYWRMMLGRQAESVEYMTGFVRKSPEMGSQRCPKTPSLEAELHEISATLTLLRTRVDNTLTVLMGSLSIYESQRAIAQAAEVKNLARLAHFYLPLTVVASICGMQPGVLPFEVNPRSVMTILMGIICMNYLLLNCYSIPLGGASGTRLWKRIIRHTAALRLRRSKQG